MALIKIAGTVNDSIVDGEGFRFSIFTQGCPHHCPECHNPQTHDFNGGTVTDTEKLLQAILSNPLLSGVTFSGGEPFCQPAPLAELAKKLHENGLDVWCYTGYTLESLLEKNSPDVTALLEQIDILVDGPFIKEQKDLTLSFRGSRNQRIINLKETLAQNKIVLYTPL